MVKAGLEEKLTKPETAAMQLNRIRALRGPNVWSRHTALEVTVDLGPAQMAVAEIPGFGKRLRDLLPDIFSGTQWAEADLTGATSESATLAHALERVAMALQKGARVPVSFSKTAATNEAGMWKVVVEYREEDVARAAVESAVQIIDAVLAERGFDVQATIKQLRSQDEDLRLGPSTGAIVRAAEARGIPTRRLNQGSLVQLGWGSRQRRILAAETDRTSAIGESIAQDKELTKLLLRSVGVPVPAGGPVKDAEEAWEMAQEIGLPVVLKPQNGNQGRGVAVNLTTREQVFAAYQAARAEGSSVLVERFAQGADHRLLVVGDRLIAAARRDPPRVQGDGKSTVAELVAAVNADPRRGEDHSTSLSKMRLDAIGLAVLAGQGYTLVASSGALLQQHLVPELGAGDASPAAAVRETGPSGAATRVRRSTRRSTSQTASPSTTSVATSSASEKPAERRRAGPASMRGILTGPAPVAYMTSPTSRPSTRAAGRRARRRSTSAPT